MTADPHPWPIDAIRERLLAGRTLWSLCGSRLAKDGFDTREHLLEDLSRDAIRERLSFERLVERGELRRTLGLTTSELPARCRPDIVLQLGQLQHILEVKSSKTDDSRFQCVLSAPFRRYLESQGHGGTAPWEVEQDLLELELCARLSDAVESCTFLMVDAYAGSGRCWSDVFSDVERFRQTMRTQMIRDDAERFVRNTVVEMIKSPDCSARLIVCRVMRR